MLSSRGQINAAQLDIPWKFLPKHTPYDPEKNPEGLISFATAENALMQEELENFALRVDIPGAAFRYSYCTAGGARLPSAFATHINEYFAPYKPVSGDDIRITAAATALHDVLAFSLAAPGEGILTSRPYYGRFEIDFWNKAGVKLVAADTDHETCFGASVVDAFEQALVKSGNEGVKIRALLIINPHNPLGRCYPRDTLIALMRFCQKHQIHLISDEIYALSVFPNPTNPDATPFTSLLSIDPTGLIDANLVHVIYGLSKDFGSAGLKVGILVTHNEVLKKGVHAVLRFHGVSGPTVAIATAMLEDRVWCRDFIELARTRLADAYQYATSRLDQIGIEYYRGGNAGFFLWVDLSKYLPPQSEGLGECEREFALTRKFMNGGVILQPGEEHAVRPGWFRIVFSMDRRIVEEGLKRIEGVVKNIEW